MPFLWQRLGRKRLYGSVCCHSGFSTGCTDHLLYWQNRFGCMVRWLAAGFAGNDGIIGILPVGILFGMALAGGDKIDRREKTTGFRLNGCL